MSHSANHTDTGPTTAFYQGADAERERILTLLQDYLELTRLPGDNGVEENHEWDAGFQAAMALIKGNAK